MPLHPFTSGEVLTAANMNEVARQTVITCTSPPSSPDTGMVIYDTNDKRILAYSGSAWNVVAWGSNGGRVGCILTRTSNQSIATATNTAILFNNEVQDSDGFYPSGATGTITIPANMGGLYMAMVQTNWAAGMGTTGGKINFRRNGSDLYTHTVTGTYVGPEDESASFAPVALSVGDTIEIRVLHTYGSNLNLTSARLEFFRIGA